MGSSYSSQLSPKLAPLEPKFCRATSVDPRSPRGDRSPLRRSFDPRSPRGDRSPLRLSFDPRSPRGDRSPIRRNVELRSSHKERTPLSVDPRSPRGDRSPVPKRLIDPRSPRRNLSPLPAQDGAFRALLDSAIQPSIDSNTPSKSMFVDPRSPRLSSNRTPILRHQAIKNASRALEQREFLDFKGDEPPMLVLPPHIQKQFAAAATQNPAVDPLTEHSVLQHISLNNKIEQIRSISPRRISRAYSAGAPVSPSRNKSSRSRSFDWSATGDPPTALVVC